MIIKRGSVVSHAVAKNWGLGKVTEINDLRAVIHFNDGIIRKIISSHFFQLEPGDPALYLPSPDPSTLPIAGAAPRKPKKAKVAPTVV